MLLYIRHSEADDKSRYVDDPKLTRDGKYMAYHQGKKLIKKYGIPTTIYCSPFLRTRHTLKYMLYGLTPGQKASINIIIEPRISRFFRRSEQRRCDVHRSTLDEKIPVKENTDIFFKRIKIAAKFFHKGVKSDGVVWCITHTTVYKRVAKLYKIELPSHIPYMDYFKTPKNFYA